MRDPGGKSLFMHILYYQKNVICLHTTYTCQLLYGSRDFQVAEVASFEAILVYIDDRQTI